MISRRSAPSTATQPDDEPAAVGFVNGITTGPAMVASPRWMWAPVAGSAMFEAASV